MGERGEEWVIAQGAILIFVAMGSVPIVGGLVMALAGPGLLAGGVGFMATGVKDLGKSLSPWPAPVKDNELNTDGVYGVVRHPMYTGEIGRGGRARVLARCSGWTLHPYTAGT